ncbi:MAG: motility protein A [Candidatus Aureabacteria bacterium]|nr:motility protein A [Candidatus Auribacterota bacterium]
MDITTVIGLILGLVLIFIAIFTGGGGGIFINVPSLLITVGGAIAATTIAFPLPEVLRVIKIVSKTFFIKSPDPNEVIKNVAKFATTARREGILALEDMSADLDDEFMKKGIQLAVDGTAPDILKEILETEIAYLEERHSAGQDILSFLADMSPAFGMIGTLIGLIQMLKTLEDPSQIGAGMAVALITTFYGAFMANLLFIPMAAKLKNRTKEEVLIKTLIIEGVMSIQSGDNPRIVEEKLKAYLAPKLRVSTEEAGGGTA